MIRFHYVNWLKEQEEILYMYLDPGFGSMLIQALVASIAAVAVGVGIFRHKIKAFFTKGKKSEETEIVEEIEATQGVAKSNINEDGEIPDDKW
jgi:hypothetical protein